MFFYCFEKNYCVKKLFNEIPKFKSHSIVWLKAPNGRQSNNRFIIIFLLKKKRKKYITHNFERWKKKLTPMNRINFWLMSSLKKHLTSYRCVLFFHLLLTFIVRFPNFCFMKSFILYFYSIINNCLTDLQSPYEGKKKYI
jgi:hypothetical protein